MSDRGDRRLLVDAHMLGEHEGGNETYIRGLLKGLESLPLDGWQVDVLAREGEYATRHPRMHLVPLAHPGNLRRVLWDIPRLCRQRGIDVLLATYVVAPWVPCSVALVVHDVIYRIYPEFFSSRDKLVLNFGVSASMRRADAVITISEASRRDIGKRYSCAEGLIHNASEAAGPVVEAPPDFEQASSLTGDRPFVLAAGNLQPRKNILRLVQAYDRLREDHDVHPALIIVGKAQWQGSEIQRVVRQSRFAEDIVFTGYVSDEVLSALYRTCTLFCYPSLYEGFGLPPVEAMACGAPVITSNTSSLPEVVGDAALMVDPEDVGALCEAMHKVLTDPALRQDLIERGLARAAQFSWHETASSVLGICGDLS